VNLIDCEPHVEEPPKRVKIINFEGIEMKFAQSVPKKQFPMLIGFAISGKEIQYRTSCKYYIAN